MLFEKAQSQIIFTINASMVENNGGTNLFDVPTVFLRRTIFVNYVLLPIYITKKYEIHSKHMCFILFFDDSRTYFRTFQRIF